jgi:hypothetical protein
MANPRGETDSGALKLDFDPRPMLRFRGSVITSDGGGAPWSGKATSSGPARPSAAAFLALNGSAAVESYCGEPRRAGKIAPDRPGIRRMSVKNNVADWGMHAVICRGSDPVCASPET